MIKKYINRNATKKWSVFEEEYILNSNAMLLIQSLKLGRSIKAIGYRLNKLKKDKRIKMEFNQNIIRMRKHG